MPSGRCRPSAKHIGRISEQSTKRDGEELPEEIKALSLPTPTP
jgi:hypothetical protein